jgi:ATPase family AAA domain-containing protein 3A/B
VPAKLKEEFVQLAKTTKEADKLGLDYQHVLFYGPPGTGKTHAAKILARSSGLDYDIIAGSAFDQFTESEALKELDNIFLWARKGKKGRLVFIDEADSLLATRSPDNPRATKMVNMFLSQLPEAQDPDIMFVLATNHPERLDPAIRSRISNALEFDLPEREQIEEQLALRFETEVISEGMSVDENIRDRLVVYADNMKGFSGRDILSAVVQARNAAIATDKETIDREIFDVVIERMIERKETERLMDTQSNRDAYFTGKKARGSQPVIKPEHETVAAPAA